MSEIFFYHLTQSRLEETLPALLARSYQRRWRAVVFCPNALCCKQLDALLWTYSDSSFLPHGLASEAYPQEQPILLSLSDENQNQAYVCFCVAGAIARQADKYQRLCLIFDGNNAEQLADARAAWKAWQAEEQSGAKRHILTYWQQTPQKKWEQKA